MTNERILQSGSITGATLEVVEIPALHGARTPGEAASLKFIAESGASLKFIRARLDGGSVTTEAGALYYHKGTIENDVPTGGLGGLIEKTIKSKLTNETAFNPVYKGKGEVILEPSFGHYVLVELTEDSIIVDKSMFYASIGNINVSVAMQNSFSSAALGGEGLFQTKIEGSGWVALSLPAPIDEIEMYTLSNETVQVDGNFGILRSKDIAFTVEKSAKGLISSALGGEGFLCTFRGTGMLWVAPTAPVYNKMRLGGMGAVTSGASNNRQ